MKGIVVKSTGSWYRVQIPGVGAVDARLRGKQRLSQSESTNPVAVGDEVEVTGSEGEWQISEISERRNYVVRKSNKLSARRQVLAANIDQIVLVVTLSHPRTSTGFIDRVLVTAGMFHIPVVLLVNKADLISGPVQAVLDEVRRIYEPIGYPLHVISALEKKGIEEVKELLHGKISLFSGHSGVGKSTLLNELLPEAIQKTGELSSAWSKGKHTTTFAEMFETEPGTWVVDTPGIRDFGVVDLEPAELGHYFPEIRALMGQCKFNNCLHENEPGCAVMAAVEEGKIHPERYMNYIGILHNEDIFS